MDLSTGVRVPAGEHIGCRQVVEMDDRELAGQEPLY